jgi:hypothetical protein
MLSICPRFQCIHYCSPIAAHSNSNSFLSSSSFYTAVSVVMMPLLLLFLHLCARTLLPVPLQIVTLPMVPPHLSSLTHSIHFILEPALPHWDIRRQFHLQVIINFSASSSSSSSSSSPPPSASSSSSSTFFLLSLTYFTLVPVPPPP